MNKFFEIVMLLAALMLLGGCGRSGGDRRSGMVVPIKAVSAAAKLVPDEVFAVGSLAADEAVVLRTEISGVIKEINFEEGCQVQAGDMLVLVQADVLAARMQEAQAQYRLARIEHQRAVELLKDEAISRQEYDRLDLLYSERKAALERAKAEVAEAAITAPFSGVMGARMVSRGQYVPVGSEIASLVRINPIKVEFAVPERYAGRLGTDLTAVVRVAAHPERDFKGKVFFVAPLVDSGTRTVLVKAQLPNDDGLLKPGMFAEVSLVFENNERVIIPESAVMLRGEHAAVYVILEDGKADLRDIVLGRHFAGTVEVLEGVSAGEIVATEGVQKLAPGVAAKIVPDGEDL